MPIFPGLSPTNLCLGLLNTEAVVIGADFALAIDNTSLPPQIFFNKVAITVAGPRNSPPIISSAGLNPSRELLIGTKNTNRIDFGPLVVDNSVIPSQIYVNGKAITIWAPSDGSNYIFTPQIDYSSSVGSDIVWTSSATNSPLNNIEFVEDTFGEDHAFVLKDGGTYRVELRLDIEAAAGYKLSLVPISGTTVLNILTGLYIQAESDILQSVIDQPYVSDNIYKYYIYAKPDTAVKIKLYNDVSNFTLKSTSQLMIYNVGPFIG
jgi:hypothetical protein